MRWKGSERTVLRVPQCFDAFSRELLGLLVFFDHCLRFLELCIVDQERERVCDAQKVLQTAKKGGLIVAGFGWLIGVLKRRGSKETAENRVEGQSKKQVRGR